MSRKEKPIVLAISADQHAGSTVGLMPYVVKTDDGNDFKANKAQRWLWRNWNNGYVARVKEISDKYGVNYTAILNGDVIEGNHHKNLQVVSHNETTQERIAEQALKPLLDDPRAERVYFLRGTYAHVGEQAQLEERVAENWKNTVKDGDNYSWRILHLDANGLRFNIAHHAPIGRLLWTRPNSLGKLAISAEIHGYRRYGRPPDIVVRAHNHIYLDSGSLFPVRIIGLPSWQLTTGYIDRLDPDALASIGGVIFTIWSKTDYEMEPFVIEPKPHKVEVIRL